MTDSKPTPVPWAEFDKVEAESNSQQTTILNQSAAIDRLITERDAAKKRTEEAERQLDLATEKISQLTNDIEELEEISNIQHADTIRAMRRGKLLELWLNVKGLIWADTYHLIQKTCEELGK